MVLSVGIVDQPNIWRKGHEPFVRAAAHLPEVEFVLVGKWKDGAIDDLRSIASENVTFTGWVPDEALLEYYRDASVYVQASAHEGFGLSVAEAMLAGCVPVVTRRGSLPEVVGDCGFYVESQSPRELAAAIEEALNAPGEFRQQARDRILTQFPLEKRAESIYQIVDGILHDRQ
jgi:glycosyltransferase involved in cell wall biosynthesis